ncbi:MAG: 1-aminocyclopropane-1-carboxylate deaminase/D-cysteine desulfhydrase [Cryomorphaceae bacterium]|nr:pyridoxal-phosphate dependent enzyme [Flavobacteriales bacterium]
MTPSRFKIPSPLQRVSHLLFSEKGIDLYVKRDDLIHPDISGNKWRKLKYNIATAQHKGSDTLLTYGGAHSNHIAATAAAAAIHGMKSIGVIRAMDADLDNPTLSYARSKGMHIHRVSREEFKNVDTLDYLESMKSMFGRFYNIPQGGANYYGVQGCMEIMSEIDMEAERLFIGCGTGTTLSGLAIANRGLDLYGVSALKGGGFLRGEVEKNVDALFKDSETTSAQMEHVHLITDAHFGGYAKIKPELVAFIRNFYAETGIKLDPIYTGKAAFAMAEEAKKKKDEKPEAWILIHTGGLQGIPAMERKMGMALF